LKILKSTFLFAEHEIALGSVKVSFRYFLLRLDILIWRHRCLLLS
jgi:hypothetical protein